MAREYPVCFQSADQWQLWRDAARQAKEAVIICDDCTAQYKAEMVMQARCDPRAAIEQFSMFCGVESRRFAKQQ